MQNPFTLSFGKKPLQYISRISQTNQIVETFRSENPVNQLFMITGVRGSGKTVMMTNIVSEIKSLTLREICFRALQPRFTVCLR